MPLGWSRAASLAVSLVNSNRFCRLTKSSCDAFGPPTALREDALHHVAFHIGQPEVAAAVAVGELFVIEAEQVQHGRVQIVDVDAVFDALAAVVVGLAKAEARLHAAAGQPD